MQFSNLQKKENGLIYKNGFFNETLKLILNKYQEIMNIIIEKSIGLTNKGKQFSLNNSAYASNLITQEAIFLLKNEKLGKSNTTDFLSISYSSTDYIGHQYGPHSKEIYDTYIKLDKDIENLLTYIDNNIGKENAIACEAIVSISKYE